MAASRPVAGAALRDGYLDGIQSLTFNLVKVRDSSLWFGPVELLRFGLAQVGPNRVAWPIEGGLLARAAGGTLVIESTDSEMVARVDGYQPRLPAPIYALTQLPFHRLLMRLHLLRERGRSPAAGVPVEPARRLAAGAIDAAMCWSVASLGGRRHRLATFVGVAAGYHIVCWSLSGRTLGGLLMRQRVVAVDGSRPSLGQAAVRLLALPLSLVRVRAAHDELAGTDVVDG